MNNTRKHILLVDDERGFLFTASLVLRKAGYRVKVAEDGKEALKLFLEAFTGEEPFDLLVTDIRMPGMSGSDLIDAVRLCEIPVAIFAISSYLNAELVKELKNKGCDAVFEKPFQPEELTDHISAIFGSTEGPANVM
ncbi:MAG TPA: response regulator [Candidatus Deferrimicrobiaceae bacterium]